MGNPRKSAQIGVVGGMGPYAGLDLVKMIFDETDATTDQEHLSLSHVSLPSIVPDRSAFLMGQYPENPAIGIVESIHKLELSGATVAGIACVTAHAAPIMSETHRLLKESSSRIRLLHIVDETVRFIRETYPTVRKIAALSTTGTFRLRLFIDALARDGFDVILQDKDVQEELVQRAIFDPECGIKSQSDPVSNTALRLVEEAITRVANQGAEAVILGCTELPLAIRPSGTYGVKLVNPTRALARALIRETFPERLIGLNP